MSTNYYWKELPPELQEIYDLGKCDTSEDGPLLHIGHSAGAGLYCARCGTTLCRGGSMYVHLSLSQRPEDTDMLSECPVCGRSDMLIPKHSFSITIWKHMDILKSRDPAQFLIEDEYAIMLTCGKLLDIINSAQVVFQDPRVWS